MEQINSTPGMLDLMVRPAFAVKDGIITYANDAAERCLFTPGTAVEEFFDTGIEEYSTLESGCLYLTLCKDDCTWDVCVTPMDGCNIFLLERPQTQPELQAVALAARDLREPLSSIMIAADRLLPALDQEDPAIRRQSAQLSRNLHRILRLVSNMSDAAEYSAPAMPHSELRDITAVIGEIFEKAAALAEQAGMTLKFTNLPQSVLCMTDAQKLERGIYNILSNAMKHTPAGGIIEAQLTHRGKDLQLTVRDSGSGIADSILPNLFSRYLRTPGLESADQGIGLGMVLIRSAAAAHGGTVLVRRMPDGGTAITMTLAIRKRTSTDLAAPIFQLDYTGGFDHALTELADVLPYQLYQLPDNTK